MIEPPIAERFYQETGDPRWLDRDYARRMTGPTMAGIFARERKALRQLKERAERLRQPEFVYLKRMLCNARKNAARRGHECTLTDDDLAALLGAAGGRCAVSGVPFVVERKASARQPYAPSLDRINGSRGYVKGNVRLVCQIANLAMNVWGAETLQDFIAKAK